MTQTNMPSRKEFATAKKQLTAAGWTHIASIAADDARNDGVTNFGTMFTKNGSAFYLNFKTINQLPA